MKTYKHNFGNQFIVENAKRDFDSQMGMADVLLMVQFCINQVTDTEILEYIDKIKQSEYYRHRVKQLSDALRKDITYRHKRFTQSMENAKKYRYDHLDREPEELIDSMCNVLDSSDSIIYRHINDMKSWLDSKIPKYGECTPREPCLIRQMVVVDVLSASCSSIYKNHLKVCHLLDDHREYEYMNMQGSYNKLTELFHHLKQSLKNKFGNQLKMNYECLYDGDILMGVDVGDGMYDRGFLSKIRNSVYTSAFIDRIYLARDGKDPHFRDFSASVLQRCPSDMSIKVE